MKLQLLQCGSCSFPDFLFQRGGKFRRRHFPALVALLHHPRRGHILFDTGYAARFFSATRRFPEKIYALTTPVEFDGKDSAVQQLGGLGIGPSDIGCIVLSHLHADHVAGLRDFPAARIIVAEDALATLRYRSRVAALREGFIPALLPDDFLSRVAVVPDFAPHPVYAGLRHHDLFGDGSLSLVPLPGHAAGHCGLLVNDSTNPVFLIADACWLLEELEPGFRRHPVASHILHDPAAYDRTHEILRDLRREHPGMTLIPCHDAVAHRLP